MSSQESREIALVASLKEDCMAAFDALYQLYFPGVYANILHLVREDAAAQDIVQEVFISLWEKAQAAAGGANAWQLAVRGQL